MAKKKKIRHQSTKSQTPLMLAAASGAKREVESLLEKDTNNVNYKDIHGKTALSHAAMNGNNCEVISVLLKHGADPESEDNDGQTPLFRAAASGDIQAVQTLITEGGANPGHTDKAGQTPIIHLVHCIKDQHHDPYRNWSPSATLYSTLDVFLLHKSALRDHQDEQGRTAFSYAAEWGNDRVVRTLLQGMVDPNCKDIYGKTALLWATTTPESESYSLIAKKKSDLVVRLLLKHEGVDPDCRDSEGRTPLSWAVASFRFSVTQSNRIIDMLLQHPLVNLESKDHLGRTPLSRAAESGNKGGVERLLQYPNLNPNLADVNGRTPLSYAAEHGQSSIVEYLLKDSRVQPDLKDNHDRTPIWWAATAGSLAVTTELLRKADINPKSADKDGETPLAQAARNGHRDLLKLFKGKDEITFQYLTRRGHLQPLQMLFDSGYEINAKNARGRTPLHDAASLGHTSIVAAFLSWGANINCPDRNGTTPLHLAIRHRQHQVVDLLLEHSAEVKGIMSHDWLRVYSQISVESHPYQMTLETSLLKIMDLPFGKRSVKIINLQNFNTSTAPKNIRSIVLFRDYKNWRRHLGFTSPDMYHSSFMIERTDRHSNHDCIFLTASFPASNSYEFSWETTAISWKMVVEKQPGGNFSWRTMEHFSTMPYGWVPEDGAECFTLFMQNLKDNWLAFMRTSEVFLAKRRDDQLQAKGTGVELIHGLAEDAKEHAKLRYALNSQVIVAHEFVAKYCHEYDQEENIDKMHLAINHFDGHLKEQINQLDQTTRDLMQIVGTPPMEMISNSTNMVKEFNWVSINEAHKSTSISTSIQRLSWITFIFLPAMFASSLFGMNVDILESNPDWRWYLLFGGGSLMLTVIVWLVFKYGQTKKIFRNSVGKRTWNTPSVAAEWNGHEPKLHTLPA